MSDAALVANAVYGMVDALSPCRCDFECLTASKDALPAVSVQSLTGAPVAKRYKSGAYVGNYRFAVYLRQLAEDNAARLDAATALAALAFAIEGSRPTMPEGFEFWGMEQDTLPVKVAADEAYDDWQSTFTLTFRKG
jgi:hypothetical protein